MQPLWPGLKRLSLGIALIATASGVLLLSDLKGRQFGEVAPPLRRTWKIYVVRYVDTPTAEEDADGMINGLAKAGLRQGRDFTLNLKSTQGDIATLNTIMNVAKTDNADLIIDRVDSLAQIARAPGLLLIHGRMEDVLPRLRNMDLVFASFILCVCDEPQETLQACASALRTGGCVLLSTNVFVDNMSAPTDREPVREINMQAPPVIDTYHGNVRRELRIVLHLPGGELPIVDRAHVPGDYAADSRDFRVSKAHLVKPQGLTFVDGRDERQNLHYYGDTGGDHVLSIDNTSAALVHLCLEMIKR